MIHLCISGRASRDARGPARFAVDEEPRTGSPWPARETPWPRPTTGAPGVLRSGQHGPDDFAVNVGEAEVATRMAVRQLGVVQPKQVQNCGV